MNPDPLRRRLPALALAIGFATATVAAATPHMLGMECVPDCPECIRHCCCPPAPTLADPPAAALPAPPAASGRLDLALPEPCRRAAPLRIHPARGPPA